MSLANLRTFLTSGVGCTKDRVKNRAPQSTMMCGFGALRHTTNGGISPSGKFASLFSRDGGVVLAPSSSRLKMSRNAGTLGLGDVAATLAMVLQVHSNVTRFGVG